MPLLHSRPFVCYPAERTPFATPPHPRLICPSRDGGCWWGSAVLHTRSSAVEPSGFQVDRGNKFSRSAAWCCARETGEEQSSQPDNLSRVSHRADRSRLIWIAGRDFGHRLPNVDYEGLNSAASSVCLRVSVALVLADEIVRP